MKQVYQITEKQIFELSTAQESFSKRRLKSSQSSVTVAFIVISCVKDNYT